MTPKMAQQCWELMNPFARSFITLVMITIDKKDAGESALSERLTASGSLHPIVLIVSDIIFVVFEIILLLIEFVDNF